MVNRKRNYTLHFYLMAVLVAIAIGSVNYLGMEYRTRIDLTADQRFTLSEGTQRLFEKLTDPVTVTYYVDAEPPSKRINLERDVRDKLEELSVSSAGKLQYSVERITNDQAASKRKELEVKGVQVTVDLLTSGTDERAETRGIQGYFSSLLISYGTAEPKAVNGIVNLVDETDEAREHRVDTLEFDIAYTVLTMRNETRRPSFDKLLKTFDKPLRLAWYITEPMPEEHRPMAAMVDQALQEISQLVPGKVDYQRMSLPAEARPQQKYPFGDGALVLKPFDLDRKAEFDDSGQLVAIRESLYFGALIMQLDPKSEQFGAIWSFAEQKTVADVRKLIEDQIWEGKRPRTRIGFILPPGDPRHGPAEPGEMPRNGHSPLLSYIQRNLAYETTLVDLQREKRIPRDLACLIVLEANLLHERELYEIERFLNEGGNVVMLVQAWSGNIDFSMGNPDSVMLNRLDVDPAFEEWAKHIGIEFGQDLLLRPNGKLQPYAIRQNREGQYLELNPGPVRLAPVVEPKDLNSTSVFTRGLAAMPLPFLVETKTNDERLRELGLEQTELIRLKDNAYRYIPSNPTRPEIPVRFNVNSKAEVSSNPSETPGGDIRAQKLGNDPLVATLISGQFPSLWVDEKRKVPGWNGDPEEADATAVLNPREGKLLVVSTAATLNIDYIYGYDHKERENVIIPRGLAFYRNLAEAFIYGDDMVSLRARTGVAPRISGEVDKGGRTLWFIICIAGVPLVLLLAAAGRSFVSAREREEYEVGLGIRADKNEQPK